VQFLDTHRNRLATFELKGPFSVPVKPERFPKILADFERQRIGAATKPQTEHYDPDVQLCGRIASSDVPLNYDGEILRVLAFRITSRERSSNFMG
jgi:hypothetical protein